MCFPVIKNLKMRVRICNPFPVHFIWLFFAYDGGKYHTYIPLNRKTVKNIHTTLAFLKHRNKKNLKHKKQTKKIPSQPNKPVTKNPKKPQRNKIARKPRNICKQKRKYLSHTVVTQPSKLGGDMDMNRKDISWWITRSTEKELMEARSRF